ncbi:exodeoxyribonuclease VII small subunit [Clostridium bovifaecis]|uniref:Exodeoxyribonuclease 7 small subunit n=1 Tax=Clostridium bovifaecis TaxID=2184719 RepID=A0A6I6FBK1_9CLOT|nr:exodeoxyribonuclease VII small subunit [Clostridium bovifaecis]
MAKKKESYEDLVVKLEEIIRQMESDEISLENSMKSYEEGINLCNKIYKMLNEAEGRVKILTESGEKNFIEADE